jgi:DNA polymerase-3 subunit epsilon
MTYLFFDTETTGLPDKRLPPDHESQPHVCQIAAIEADESGRTMTEINFLIKPDGWRIPEQASAIHGITQTAAEQYGIKIDGAMSIMRRLVSRSRTVVAHNVEFDEWMLRRETGAADWAVLKDKAFCTMTGAIDRVKCPPTEKMVAKGVPGFKKPSLAETYRHFFGRDFDGAHDAMADVRACRDVFFRLREEGAVPAPEVAA